jgi:hypothetical protein
VTTLALCILVVLQLFAAAKDHLVQECDATVATPEVLLPGSKKEKIMVAVFVTK